MQPLKALMERNPGVGLIQTLMDAQSFSKNRILVITGEASNSKEAAWVAAQGIPIVRKPFTVKALFDAIDDFLRVVDAPV